MAASIGIGRFVYTPILPPMVEALSLTKAEAGLIASSNFVGYLAGALLAALRLPGSRRTWLLGGLALNALALAAMAATTSLALFLLLRLAAGMASAFCLIFSSALVLDRLARAGRGKLSAVHFAGVGIGIAVSAAVVATLTDWRSMWLASAILASTAIPAVFPSVTIDGHRYVDGGLLDHFGVEVAYEQGATHIVAIDCPHLPPKGVHGILAPMARALWVSVRHLRRLGAKRFEFDPRMLTLEPEVDIDSYKMTDFSRTTELIQQAQSWAVNYLREQGQAFLEHLDFGIANTGLPAVSLASEDSEPALQESRVVVSTSAQETQRLP